MISAASPTGSLRRSNATPFRTRRSLTSKASLNAPGVGPQPTFAEGEQRPPQQGGEQRGGYQQRQDRPRPQQQDRGPRPDRPYGDRQDRGEFREGRRDFKPREFRPYRDPNAPRDNPPPPPRRTALRRCPRSSPPRRASPAQWTPRSPGAAGKRRRGERGGRVGRRPASSRRAIRASPAARVVAGCGRPTASIRRRIKTKRAKVPVPPSDTPVTE